MDLPGDGYRSATAFQRVNTMVPKLTAAGALAGFGPTRRTVFGELAGRSRPWRFAARRVVD
jgi:hypothetical protein